MISPESIREVQNVAKIEEVIGDFITVRKKGSNYVALCPFHNDKNPSMHINPAMGIYKCFVCDAGGDSIKFVMEYEKISYPEAIRYLAAKYQIQLVETAQQTPEDISAQNEKERLFHVNLFAAKYFREQLWNTEYGKAVGLGYLKERGISEAMIEKFELGYHPDDWDSFSKTATANGYEQELLLKLGLCKQTEQGRFFDFFKGRLMFPIHNQTGKIAGFGGRILVKSDHKSKYFNSPESDIYHKSDILYGFYFAKRAIRKEDAVYLVEGYTDVISMHQIGIENVVASSGTALTEGQIKLIATQTKNIIVLYDGDEAGINASLRGVDLILAAGLHLKVITLPENEDPDSFSKKQSKEEVLHYFQTQAQNFVTFKARVLSKQTQNDPIKKSKVINEILDHIAQANDLIIQSIYIKECAEIFNIPEPTLQQQLRMLVLKKRNKHKAETAETPLESLPESVIEKSNEFQIAQNQYFKEEALIRLLLEHGNKEIYQGSDDPAPIRVDQYIYNTLSEDDLDFEHPVYALMFKDYADFAEAEESILHAFCRHEVEEVRQIALNLCQTYSISPFWKEKYQLPLSTTTTDMALLIKEVEDCVHAFKLEKVQHRIQKIQEQITETQDEIEQERLLKKFALLNQIKNQIAKKFGIVVCG